MEQDNIFEVIHNRKSIRKFANEKNDREDLMTIGKAARATPTSVNLQSRKFTMIQNKSLIQQLANALGQIINQPNYDFYKPDAILLISSRRGYTVSE